MKRLLRFLCPLVFLLAHTALVVWVWIGVRTSDDGVAVMAWLLFAIIDWPASAPLFPASNDGNDFVFGIMFMGGLQWFLIGFALQRFVEWLATPTLSSTLHCPPFPPLQWEHYSWVGEIILPSWAGFQARRGGSRAVHSRRPSDGTAYLSISPSDWKSRTPPTAEQVAAYRHLIDNEKAVAAAVAQALVEYCPGHAYDGDDEELLGVSGPADLRPLIGLSAVHVLNVFHEGAACIGFEFGCVWDEEHGAGVMTHMGRVIATGQTECSFVEWIARDGLDEL